MKNIFKLKYLLFAVSTLFIFTACEEDEAAPEEEEEMEVITDVKLIFTNQYDPTDTVTARAQDPDGTGVQELKVLNGIVLKPNKQWILTFEIMNNLESPGEDIGKEILEEGASHQIFFDYPPEAFCEFGYLDEDVNGLPRPFRREGNPR